MKTPAFKSKQAVLRICIAFLLIITSISLSSCNLFSPTPSAPSDSKSTTDETVKSHTFEPADEPEIMDKAPKEIKTTYGYDNLKSEKSKELYHELNKTRVSVYPPEISCDGEASGFEITSALYAFSEDFPEVFWLNSYSYSYLFENGKTYVMVEYHEEGGKLADQKDTFFKAVDDFVSTIPAYKDEFYRELYIFDYIIDNCTYDEDRGHTNDAYGPIVDKFAVCEGYTRAFQLLCNRSGIEVTTVSGYDSSDEEAYKDGTIETTHIWNCVKIDGKWYQIDLTWCDSDYDSFYEYERYLYFNTTSEEMYKTHVAFPSPEKTDDEWDYNLYIPKCNGTEKSYYNVFCPVLTSLDDCSQIVAKLAESAKNKNQTFYLIIGDNLDFEDTAISINIDGYLDQWVFAANLVNGNSPHLERPSLLKHIEDRNVVYMELTYE